MALHNYIWRRLYDGVVFIKFNRNPNFVPGDTLHDVVAHLENHGTVVLVE